VDLYLDLWPHSWEMCRYGAAREIEVRDGSNRDFTVDGFQRCGPPAG
jgi:hypothetical protein